jgi:hypothetical protein
VPAINVSSAAGTHITGLTVGGVYSIATSGGPWHWRGLSGGSEDTYIFGLSLTGTSFSPGIGTSTDPFAPTSDTYAPSWADGRENVDSLHPEIWFTATQTDLWVGVPDSVYTDNTGGLDYVLTSYGSYCSHGTRRKSGVPVILTLLPEALLQLVGLVTSGWPGVFVGFFAGRALDIGALCSTIRPAPVDLDANDIAALLSPLANTHAVPASVKAWNWLRWAAWPVYCECTPGTPTPTPPPPLILPAPPGVADGPPSTLVCSNSDLCAALNSLVIQLNALSSQIVRVDSTVTLMQRQNVPFAYVPGAVHSGLTGAGTFAVQGILGLSVNATAKPGYLSSDMAPVQSWFKLGELSWGTADGWLARRIVTHDPHLYLGIEGDITAVAYEFEPGVTATITELVREP